MKTLKKIPKFKNEDAEREFWSKHDFTEYFDFSKVIKATFPNLKPSTSFCLSSTNVPKSQKILEKKFDILYR